MSLPKIVEASGFRSRPNGKSPEYSEASMAKNIIMKDEYEGF